MIIRLAEELQLSSVLDRREAIIAVATTMVSAAALHADWLIMSANARLIVPADRAVGDDSGGAEAVHFDSALIGALVWRMGARARPFLLSGPSELRGNDALPWGIADAVVPDGLEALEWTRRWASSRSGRAMDVAAQLLRSRGGDPLERVLFAWLFATGEPQEGLGAFLEKRPARFPAEG